MKRFAVAWVIFLSILPFTAQAWLEISACPSGTHRADRTDFTPCVPNTSLNGQPIPTIERGSQRSVESANTIRLSFLQRIVYWLEQLFLPASGSYPLIQDNVPSKTNSVISEPNRNSYRDNKKTSKPILRGVSPSSGYVGSTVSVFGDNLGTTAIIRFGNKIIKDAHYEKSLFVHCTKASVGGPAPTCGSSETFYFFVPAISLGTYEITVENSGGISSSTTFTVSAMGEMQTCNGGDLCFGKQNGSQINKISQ